jgi:hypothetical protein
MESPVWTPMGSTFSMLVMMTTVSAWSRITSSSNSFQPSTDSSTKAVWTGERARPRARTSLSSPSSLAMPPPVPPRVKEGRTTTGKPTSQAKWRPSSTQATIFPRGTSRPIFIMAFWKASRSSPFRMASALAPMSSTP